MAGVGIFGGVGGVGGLGFVSKVFFDRVGVDAGGTPPVKLFVIGMRLILSEPTGCAASAVLGGLGCADLASFCLSSALSA